MRFIKSNYIYFIIIKLTNNNPSFHVEEIFLKLRNAIFTVMKV